MTQQETKSEALARLRYEVAKHEAMLTDIDPRLTAYMQDVAANEPDTHNLYEIAGCLRWLRLADTYEVDAELMHRIFLLIEGRWQNGRYIEGGLSFEGMRGKSHYRLTRFQVWAFTSLFALYCWVPTDRRGDEPDLQLADTETVNPDDGMVYDRRRLITD